MTSKPGERDEGSLRGLINTLEERAKGDGYESVFKAYVEAHFPKGGKKDAELQKAEEKQQED